MIKFEKSHIFIIIFLILAFFTGAFVMKYRSNKRFKNVKTIEKYQKINIFVDKDYYNRGVAVFNDKYSIIAGRLKKSKDIEKIFYIKPPYKLLKEKNSDTIWLSNNDTTFIMVLK